jgi:DNA-binding transcriptional LysR family regulator
MWDEYRVFLAVLRGGGLAAATDGVDLVHATVRRRVRSLERRLGEPLFIHTAGGLMPTPAAWRLAPYAASMEGLAAAFARTAAAPASSTSGLVRVSAPDIFCVELLPSALRELAGRRPDIDIELSIAADEDHAASRTSDIHILVAPMNDLPRTRAITWGLFADPDFLARRGRPRELADLTTGRLVGARSPGADDRLLAGLGFAGADISYAFRVDGRHHQLAAVRAGLGVGFCPVVIADRDPKLVRVLPKVSVRQGYWILANPILSAIERVSAVHDHLAESLGRAV